MTGTLHHTTRAHAAHEARHEGIRLGWLLVIVCLVLTAGGALALRPVCLLDVPGARESAAGVRHVKRAGRWYHCEPWLVRALAD